MSARAAILVVASIGFVVLVVAGARHRRHEFPGRPTIVQLELAGSGTRLHALLTALGEDGRRAMRRALDIDRWIIVGYALLAGGTSLLSVWAMRMASDNGWRTAGTVIALAVAGAVVVAAMLDVVENRALAVALRTWTDPPTQHVPPTESNAAERQAHRRDVITALTGPAERAARAARPKFAILLALWPAWMVTVSTVCVAHTLG
jgi:hypothetical protein